jgi:glycosyltransferase involved in cell wall biosynthesis
MKLGVIARAEDRGLGIQTWEAVRHLQPDRVLVVDVENPEGFPLHLDRYPGATVARLQTNGRDWWFGETLIREWLDGLDVVFSCETVYDWRLIEWARDQHVSTVVQLNPEFFLHRHVPLPEPTAWWNPSTWRMDQLPASVRHVPVPVALDRFAEDDGKLRRGDGALRLLHVVGRPAMADRNGTELLAKAMRRIGGVELTVTSQRATVHAQRVVGEVADYWRLYDDQDVLVMPRRYGGLCLPVQEAMAAGLAVVMPACPPNPEMWPIVPVRWQYRGQIEVPAGSIPLAETDARDLAAVLGRLRSDELALYEAQSAARAWAAAHSWEALLPLYRVELERAAGG